MKRGGGIFFLAALVPVLLANFFIGGCHGKNNLNLGQSPEIIFNNRSPSASPAAATTPSGQSAAKDLESSPTHKEKKSQVILDAPIIKQNPELRCGCEVTSLAMMLEYAGVKVDKMQLAGEIKKDRDALMKEGDKIVEWGNPEEGFVGDITGKTPGFGVYNKPIYQLANQYLPGRAVDLTGQPFSALLDSLNQGRPVVVWLTTDLDPPHSFKSWKDGSDGEKVRVTFQEHAVLLTGYDEKYCYINNPLNGQKNEKLPIEEFKKIWTDMGSMAVSYK